MNLGRTVLKEAFLPESRGVRGRLRRFQNRYRGIFRAAKLAAGSGVGFLDTEIILIFGSFLLYGKPNAPSNAFYSPIFFLLNIVAFVVGVTVAFFVSDSLIMGENCERNHDLRRTLARLGRFQLIFLAGNLAMVAVEMLLLREFSLPPVLGMIVGAITSFPLSYFFSMSFVFQLNDNGPRDLGFTPAQRKMSYFSLRNPTTMLPNQLVTPYGNYDLDVQEYRFDVHPIVETGSDEVEFVLKVDVTPEV
jgi:putative flippase GtrA